MEHRFSLFFIADHLTLNENNTGGKVQLLREAEEALQSVSSNPLNYGEGNDSFARPDPKNVNHQMCLLVKAQVLGYLQNVQRQKYWGFPAKKKKKK